LDDDYTWESLGALTADLAGMSADMAALGRRPSPSLVPSKDSVPQYGASPPPPPRDTNSVPDVELQNLAQAAQAASPNPPQDLDFRRLLLAKETQMIEVEKLKLQLELARIQASSISTTPDESTPGKPHEQAKSLGDLRAPQRTLYPQQWPHILAPACPTAPIPLSGNGTLSSLHYPFANYPVSKNCYWLITASAGKRIKVTFKHFSMGLFCNPGDCERGNCPYVDLLDGPSTNSPYLARYCTKSVPTTIISSGQQMYVKFYSGFSPDRGFLAEYSETTDEPSPTVTRPPTTTTTTAKPPTTGAAVLTITLFLVILPSFAATMLSP